MKLPDWLRPNAPKETALQWAAALASFFGTVVFTIGAGLLVWIVWKGDWSKALEAKRLDLLGWAMMLMLGGSISGNWAFGFLLSKRTLKITKDGLEVSGGADADATTTTTTATATTTVAAPPKPSVTLP